MLQCDKFANFYWPIYSSQQRCIHTDTVYKIPSRCMKMLIFEMCGLHLKEVIPDEYPQHSHSAKKKLLSIILRQCFVSPLRCGQVMSKQTKIYTRENAYMKEKLTTTKNLYLIENEDYIIGYSPRTQHITAIYLLMSKRKSQLICADKERCAQ